MAKKTTKTLSDDDIVKAIARKVRDAVGFCDDTIKAKQAEALRLYKREPLDGDDALKGQSKYVTSQVQQKVDGGTANIVRVFDTSDRVVEFNGNGPEDDALADQMTAVCNHIVRNKNAHTLNLQSQVFNGFLTGIGVTMVDFCIEYDEGLPKIIKGVTEQQLVEFTAREDAKEIIIEEASEPYKGPQQAPQGLPPQVAQLVQMAMPAPNLYDLKIRSLKRHRVMKIVNLPPERFIVSKDAEFDPQTGGIKAQLQGHSRIMTRKGLVAQGFPQEKIDAIPNAEDNEHDLATERSRDLGFDQGIGDVNEDVEVFEIYTKMRIVGDKERHYRITLAGDLENSPVLLKYVEVSKYYPYAAFTPYPIANTLFGQSIADLIGPDQILTTKFTRAIHNNLNLSIRPPMVVNQDVVNMDDLMNIHSGKAIRARGDSSSALTYLNVPFSASAALPIIDSMNATMDLITGFGGSLMAVNASDLQNTTATAASQRINQLNTPVEMICRHFADTGYRYLFRVIIDQLVQYPDDAMEYIKRLTGKYVDIKVDDFDPDMDITATVAFGVLNKDGNRMDLQMILNNQMQAKQSGMRFASDENIYATMMKMAENAGFKNAAQFFTDPKTLPPLPPPPAPVDPNAGLVEIEKVKAQLKAESDQRDYEFQWRKFIAEQDFKRDEMAAKTELERAKIEAEYGAQVDMARIQPEQAAQRNDVDFAIAQQTAQVQAMQQHQKDMSELDAKNAEREQKLDMQLAAMQQKLPPEEQSGPQGAPMPPQE